MSSPAATSPSASPPPDHASAPPPAEPGAVAGRTGSRLVLALTAGATFVAFLDTTVVNVAFPDLASSFPADKVSDLSWVVSGYAVLFAALLTAAGRIADAVGRRRVFLASLAVFTAASALCAAAPDLPLLIAARAVQGAAAAGMIPAALGLLLASTPPAGLAVAIGAWGAAGSMATAAGPALGGVLVNAFGWRSVFLVNLPAGLILLAAGIRSLPERTGGERRLPDPFGTAAVTGGIALLVLGLTKGSDWGWHSAATLATTTAGAALAGAAVRRSATASASASAQKPQTPESVREQAAGEPAAADGQAAGPQSAEPRTAEAQTAEVQTAATQPVRTQAAGSQVGGTQPVRKRVVRTRVVRRRNVRTREVRGRSARERWAPAVETGLFGNRAFAVASGSAAFTGAALFAWLLSSPLFLTSVWHYSVLKAGFAVTPGAVTSAVAAVAVGRRARPGQLPAVVAVSMAAFAAVMVWMYVRLGGGANFLALWLPVGLVGGAAFGAALTALSTAAARALPPHRFASGVGMTTTARQLGGALGVAATGAILAAHPAGGPAPFREVCLACALLAAAAGAVALATYRTRTPTRTEESRS